MSSCVPNRHVRGRRAGSSSGRASSQVGSELPGRGQRIAPVPTGSRRRVDETIEDGHHSWRRSPGNLLEGRPGIAPADRGVQVRGEAALRLDRGEVLHLYPAQRRRFCQNRPVDAGTASRPARRGGSRMGSGRPARPAATLPVRRKRQGDEHRRPEHPPGPRVGERASGGPLSPSEPVGRSRNPPILPGRADRPRPLLSSLVVCPIHRLVLHQVVLAHLVHFALVRATDISGSSVRCQPSRH